MEKLLTLFTTWDTFAHHTVIIIVIAIYSTYHFQMLQRLFLIMAVFLSHFMDRNCDLISSVTIM